MLLYFLSRPNTTDIALQLVLADFELGDFKFKTISLGFAFQQFYYRVFRTPTISNYFSIPLRIQNGEISGTKFVCNAG